MNTNPKGYIRSLVLYKYWYNGLSCALDYCGRNKNVSKQGLSRRPYQDHSHTGSKFGDNMYLLYCHPGKIMAHKFSTCSWHDSGLYTAAPDSHQSLVNTGKPHCSASISEVPILLND